VTESLFNIRPPYIFCESLIFRINNLAGNSCQIFGFKRLMRKILRINQLASIPTYDDGQLNNALPQRLRTIFGLDTFETTKLIFRINNLGENYRQIIGFKRLTGKIFKNQ
jgi:hypothetical protein